MPEVNIILPDLHPGQIEVARGARRFNVICAGRRWGKNEFGKNRVVQPLLGGKKVGWFSPTYKTLAEDWRILRDLLRPITRDKSEQEHRLVLRTAGVLEMWSLEEPDTARGRAYHRAIIDEAATVPQLQYAWEEVLTPELADFSGDAWFLSTPKGMNFFWQLYLRGQNQARWAHWASWQRPTSENPHIPPEEIDLRKAELPDAAFRQEFLAEFVEGTSGVFRRIDEAVGAVPQELPVAGHTYLMGVDWGKRLDFTVVTLVDASTREQVYLDRMQMVDYGLQVGRIEAIARRFKPDLIVPEENSIGIPLIEQLQRLDLPIRPFKSTNASKKELIERLSLAFEKEELRILDHPIQTNELKGFQVTKTATGLERYAAPEGMHDDTVIALALAWSAAVAYPKIQPIPDWRHDPDLNESEDSLVGPGGYVWRR